MLPKSADVVVIGGGVLGTSAAFHLSAAGQKNVVVLDRGAIASGTTPFAAGQTGYLTCDRLALKFGAYNVDFFSHFEKHTGHAIDFQQSGSLRVALTDKYKDDLESRIQAAAEIGHEVQILSHQVAKSRVPLFDPPSGCQILSVPKDGYVEPKSVAVAYASGACDRGATIHTRTNVSGLEIHDGRVKAVQTDQGVIETDWVVLAAGAWTRQFGQRLGLNLRTVPVRHQAFDTAPIKGVKTNQPIVRITEPQVYVRQEAGGLLVGGYGYQPRTFDMNDFPEDFEIPALAADQAYYQELRAAAAAFFPALTDAVVVRERRGLPTISPDGRLLVSETREINGLIIVSGCAVGGVDRSPGTGRLVADIITGRDPWFPLEGLTVDRFGDEFANDGELRERCQEIYAHHYHEIY